MIETFYQCDRATLYQGNCLEVMPQLEPNSFNCILADLPYSQTSCSWDKLIPFEPLWECYKRLIKPNGAIVLFASQPFTSMLVTSNLQWFKYCLVWEKTLAVGFQNAKFQPLKSHEDICVFSQASSTYSARGSMTYTPQMQKGKAYTDKRTSMRSARLGHRAATTLKKQAVLNEGTRYPRSVIKFANGNNNTSHPTEKPVDLMSFLVRSYTNPGDRILDNTAGSFSTGVAAVLEGRKFTGIEQDESYCSIGKRRIADALTEVDSMLIKPWELQATQQDVAHEQTELFGASA